MTRKLIRTTAFVRAARRHMKNSARAAADIAAALETLAQDAFHPRLKTHKLKGDLAGTWACSAGYDLRIIFEFARHQDRDVIVLLSIGTHDAVY